LGKVLLDPFYHLSLIKAGYTVTVINQLQIYQSSKIAAGIWNPIVFKRLTKSWLADDLVPELHFILWILGKRIKHNTHS
jgi:glycine oxidase